MLNKIKFIVTVGGIISLIGTMFGASIGIILKNPSKKFIGNINGFAGGLMLSIVVLDLIPEARINISFFSCILFFICGMLIIFLIDFISKIKGKFSTKHSKTAFMAAIGLMIHNFPEGIIMGAGFLTSGTLGIKMSLIIGIHDIPEGIAVVAPLMAANVNSYKILFYAFITAFPTVIGAWIGALIGNISSQLIGVCLSVASGIMVYVVFAQMIPEAIYLWRGKSIMGSILLGGILGLVITILL